MRSIGLILSCLVLIGCSTFNRPDGTQVNAPDPVKIEAGTQTVASGAALIGGPFGIALAGLITVLGTAIAAHYRGKEVGWTQAVGQPAIPGEAGITVETFKPSTTVVKTT